ncbi:hypothetical protein [Haliovirga abyssi]|uniref:Translocation and assembly module TamB C-terminal domain-containing protein n=1 Tax=Haliovirga abyssi TaxID=2996794 RepID=A0AAU9D6Y6_9FUSO|nr:hypothetical protein [Haliovirga abyssi]BDU50313.1 hypothetical protein HLVA_08820 [Haliovirga abyssi]
MRDLIKKHKYAMLMPAFIIVIYIFTNLYITFKYQIQNTVKTLTKTYANLNINFVDMKIKNINEVELKDFIFKSKKGKVLLKAPRVKINFNIFPFKLSTIKVIDGKINFEMYKNSKINFLTEFENKESDSKENKEIPLNKIIFENSNINFQDFSKKNIISRDLKNSNGIISFYNGKIKIIAEGSTKYKEKLNLNLTFDKKLKLLINIKNLLINENDMQYIGELSGINRYKGRGNITLTIEDKNINVKGDFHNASLHYNEIEDKIYNINGKFDYKNKRLNLYTFGYVSGKKYDLNLLYLNSKLNIKISTKNITYNDVEKFKPIKNLNLKIKGKIEKANVDFNYINDKPYATIIAKSKKIFVFENELKNVNLKMVYDEKRLNIKNVEFSYSKDNLFSGELVGNAILTGKKIDGNIEIKKIKNIYIESLTNLKGTFIGQLDKNIIEINLKNKEFGNIFIRNDFLKNSIEIKSKIIKKQKLKIENQELLTKGNLDINYNFKNLEFEKGSFNLEGEYKNISCFVNGTILSNIMRIKKLYIKNEIAFGTLDGLFNLKTFFYKLNIKKSRINVKGSNIDLYTDGILTGKKEKFYYSGTISSEKGNYIGNYSGLKGKINLSYNGIFKGNFLGELKKIEYNNFNFQDLSINISLNDKILSFKNISNRFVTVLGDYNIDSKNMDLKYELTNYKLNDLKWLDAEGLNLYIKKINGKISGDFTNPKIYFDLKELNLKYKKNDILFSGNGEISDNILKLNKAKIDDNLITGKIDLINKNIDIHTNIFEENLNKYYDFKIPDYLKYRILGDINIWGNIKNLKSVGELNIDSINYKDIKLPSLYCKFSYNKGNVFNFLNSGIFDISNIEIRNYKNRKTALKGKGIANFKDKEFSLKIPDQNININNFGIDNINGQLNVKYNFIYKNKNIEYELIANSDMLNIFDAKIINLENHIEGNNSELTLKILRLYYNSNKFEAYGNLDMKNLKYNFRINAQKLRLKTFAFLLKDKLKLIDGEVDANIYLNDDSTYGTIKLNRGSLITKDEKIVLKNISGIGVINKNKFSISKFYSDINGGDLSGSGNLELDVPDISNIMKYKPKINNWDFNIKAENVKYYLNKNINVLFDTNLKIKNKNILGSLKIKSGEFSGIESGLKKDNKNYSDIFKGLEVGLDVSISKEFKIHLANISILEDLEASISGNGNLTIENKKINFLGTISTEEGVITVNNNDFKIENGFIVFDDPYLFFPELNPSISLLASTNIAGETIDAQLLGDLKSIKLNLSSSSNLNYSDIISLLTFHKKIGELSPGGVVRDVLARQLNSEIVFNPLSKRIAKILGISKFKLYSNILEINDKEGELNLTNDIRLGATLDLGNSLYKNILFWNVKGKLSDEISGKIDYYDVWLNYKINDQNNVSAGIKEEYSDDIGKSELHIGWNFKYKIYKWLDMINIFNIPKK